MPSQISLETSSTSDTFILDKVDEVFLGVTTFEELATKATDALSEKIGLLGGSVFRLHEDQKELRTFIFTPGGLLRKKIVQILPRPFSTLKLSLLEKENLLNKTVLNGQEHFSFDLWQFGRGILPRYVTKGIARITGHPLVGSFPIQWNGKKYGVLITSLINQKRYSDEQLRVIRLFAKQLAKAMESVQAFEKFNAFQRTGFLATTTLQNVSDVLLGTEDLSVQIKRAFEVLVSGFHLQTIALYAKNHTADETMGLQTCATTQREHQVPSSLQENLSDAMTQVLERKTCTQGSIAEVPSLGTAFSLPFSHSYFIARIQTETPTVLFVFTEQKFPDEVVQALEAFARSLAETFHLIASHKQTSQRTVRVLKDLSQDLLTSSSPKEIAQKAADTFLEDLKLLGLGIYTLDIEQHRLTPFAYSNSHAFRHVARILPKRFTELSVDIKNTTNLLVRAMTENVTLESSKLEEFSYGALHPRIAKRLQQMIGVHAMRAIPISQNGDVLGVIHAGIAGEKFEPFQEELLSQFASQLAITLRSAQQNEKKDQLLTTATQSEKALFALQDLEEQFTGSGSVMDIAKQAMGYITTTLDLLGASFMIYDKEKNELRHVLYESKVAPGIMHKLIDPYLNKVIIPLDKPARSLIAKAASEQKSQITNAVADVLRDVIPDTVCQTIQKQTGGKSMIVIPLVHERALLGTIVTGSRNPSFSDAQLAALRIFSDRLSFALYTALQKEHSHKSATEATSEKTLLALENINQYFVGTGDIFDIAKQAMGHITTTLDLLGASLYRYDETTNELRHVLYETRTAAEAIHKILDPHLHKLHIRLDQPSQSLIARAVLERQIFETKNLTDITHGMVPDVIAKSMEHMTNTGSIIVLPLLYQQRLFGAIVIGSKRPTFTDNEHIALKLFCQQLSLAMGSAFEREKLLREFERDIQRQGQPEPERPEIKFTLRITKRMNEELTRQAAVAGMSKADYMRQSMGEKLEETSPKKI